MAQLTSRAPFALVLLAMACTAEERPPLLTVIDPRPVPVACAALVEHGFDLQGTRLVFDGGVANCAVLDLSCPVSASAECEAGAGVIARCASEVLEPAPTDLVWRLECREVGAGGAAGGGGAGGSAG